MSELRERWTSAELVDVAAEWRLQAEAREAALDGRPEPTGPARGKPLDPANEAAAVKAILGGG